MDLLKFNEEVKPLLEGYSIEYLMFQNGEFGDLARVELISPAKVATVDFWSKGWVGIDIYDCKCDEQVMNILVSPDERSLFPQVFEEFINKMGLISE